MQVLNTDSGHVLRDSLLLEVFLTDGKERLRVYLHNVTSLESFRC